MKEKDVIQKCVTIKYLLDKDLRDIRVRHLYNRYVNTGINKVTALSRAEKDTSYISASQIFTIPHTIDTMDVAAIVHDIAKGNNYSFEVELI